MMDDKQTKKTPWRKWAGRVITGLAALPFALSAAMKLRGGPQVGEMMAHLGIPETLLLPLAVLELTCLVIYLLPPTAVLGAVLLTGYVGGAICSHLRVGDPYFIPIGIGLLVWLGVALRDDRLWGVLPLKRSNGRNFPGERA